jgi:hypothetical protein
MPLTGRFQKNWHTPVSRAGWANAAMFGDAARWAVGRGTFVPAHAPIAIPAIRCTEPMALMVVQGIGLRIRRAVGEIGGNGKSTGMTRPIRK